MNTHRFTLRNLAALTILILFEVGLGGCCGILSTAREPQNHENAAAVEEIYSEEVEELAATSPLQVEQEGIGLGCIQADLPEITKQDASGMDQTEITSALFNQYLELFLEPAIPASCHLASFSITNVAIDSTLDSFAQEQQVDWIARVTYLVQAKNKNFGSPLMMCWENVVGSWIKPC